jgi:DNA-binding transcriptional LysR family regulator
MSFDGRLLSGMSVLAAVVEAGSFSRAGENLGLSASGVSRSVARLEERLGVRLLNRTTRTLHLTDEGSRLYELAAPHLEGIEEAANFASGAAVTVRGALRVSLNPIFARHVLAPKLPLLRERYPGLELTILQHQDVGDLVTEGIDVAVRFGPQPTSTMTYIDPRGGKPFHWEFQRGSEVVPVETKGHLTLTDVDTMVQACVAGAGIAQLLYLGVEHLLSSGALIELFPDWPGETFPLYIVRPSRRLAPAAVEAFLEFCREICGG